MIYTGVRAAKPKYEELPDTDVIIKYKTMGDNIKQSYRLWVPKYSLLNKGNIDDSLIEIGKQLKCIREHIKKRNNLENGYIRNLSKSNSMGISAEE